MWIKIPGAISEDKDCVIGHYVHNFDISLKCTLHSYGHIIIE